MADNESEVRNDYAEFRAKQEARKTASYNRITAKTTTISKEVSQKYIPDNLKVIARLSVGEVQQVSNAKDVEADGENFPPLYLYPRQINSIQVITRPDNVSAILVKNEDDKEVYELTGNFEVYNKLGEPNKLIVVTATENIPSIGLSTIATQNGPVQQLSDAKDVDGAPMEIWAKANNAIQVITEPDDVAYILNGSSYELTDNFEVYNKLGEPNKLIAITTKNEVLNVPVVEETESSTSSETSGSSESSSSN